MTTQEIIASLEKTREEWVNMFFNCVTESTMDQAEKAIAMIDRRLELERAKL